ncbi:MAG: hypothetical protein AB7P08_12720 [Burkholderiales bacterium]
MITLVFKVPSAEFTVSETAVLAYAGVLAELATQRDVLPIPMRLPNNKTWKLRINTDGEALAWA